LRYAHALLSASSGASVFNWDKILSAFLSGMNRIFHFGATASPLGPLERRLLEAVWERGNATVRELLESGNMDLAYTTLMTTLDRLYKKNLLSRQAEGRAFRYAPRFSREELHRQAAGEAFRQMLDASPASSLPLSYLVEIVSEHDAQLLDDLSRLVESKQRELRSGAGQKTGFKAKNIKEEKG
jgi:predicted transcriptional regulator